MPRAFHLTNLPEPPEEAGGFVHVSTTVPWERWIIASLPAGLHDEVQARLRSNLKHILVALEMKAALIVPHAERGNGPSILFEPYLHMMSFEFCVGVFSVCEGIGAALWLRENGLDGDAAQGVYRPQWKPPLVAAFDPQGEFGLDALVDRVGAVRDKLHQDRLGARAQIDWHDFEYAAAFQPALAALHCLLRQNLDTVPVQSNLRPDWQ